MSELNIYGAVNGNTVTEYPGGDKNGSLSTTPKKGDDPLAGGFDVRRSRARLLAYQISNPQLDRVLAVVREYCAIGRESKKAENGRQALEHTRAVRMAIYKVGERDTGAVCCARVTLASFGICGKHA
jgi:hypothetical protein